MDNPTVPAQAQTLSAAQAATKLAERRNAADMAQQKTEAARTLGQASAQARQERQAETETEPQAETEEVLEVSETTATDNPTEDPAEIETTEETWSDDRTIPLGDGVEVTLKEVKDSFFRQADYTKKTTEVANMRKEVEAEKSQKLAKLDDSITFVESLLGQEPNWLAHAQQVGGDQAIKDKFAWDQRQTALQQHKLTLQEERTKSLMQAKQNMHKTLAENYNPQWLDESKRNADYDEIAKFAIEQGISQDELMFATNPAHIKVLDMARKYLLAQKARPEAKKVLSKAPPVTKPGVRTNSQENKVTTIQRAQASLAKSGSLADAVAAMRAKRAAS